MVTAAVLYVSVDYFNSFTARPQPVQSPGGKVQGRPYKQCLFRSYETSTFNTMRFDQIPFTHQCEKEDKQTEGFQILHLYWSFSSGVVAVKWLKAWSG